MKPFFHFDTEEARKTLLSRARNVALWTIQQYEIEWNSIRFIQVSDTITFKIETNTTGNYLLRIHSDRVNKEEIISELFFLNELRKRDGLIVPEAMINRNGSYVLECPTEEGYSRPYVSIMKWVEGEHLNDEFTENHAHSIGIMIGKLHEASIHIDSSQQFDRPTWGITSFKQEITKLELYYPRFLSNEAWNLYQKAISKIIMEMSNMQPSSKNHGLIHADLHIGNMVFNNNLPYPIDFGRCGYGYFVYDIAAVLLQLFPKHRSFLIEGYETIVKLEQNYICNLETFFIMHMIENYCHHSSDFREIPQLIEEQKYALAYITEYINNRSFLFNVLEPVNIEQE